jgi:hypothetical protein
MYKQKKKEVPADYSQVIERLEKNYEEVPGEQFYSEIFPDNESRGDMHYDFSHPNAVYLYRDGDKMRRHVMLKDTWHDDWKKNVKGNHLALCSGLTYRGRSNKLEDAQRMNAMIFDLDNVGPSEFGNVLYHANNKPGTISGWAMPMPTYIVASGSGLHLYYVFTEPLDLYPNIKLQAKELKYNLTRKIWDWKVTSRNKDVQFQGISQGFRMVGSINEKYGTVVRAFRTGERIPFEFFNEFAAKDYQVDLKKPYRPSQVSLKEAQHKYPEWYQRRIVEKQSAGHWVVKKDLYNWWKRKIDDPDVVRGGYRYFFLMMLAIYATKCDVSKDELRNDMISLMPTLQSIKNEGDPFTMQDVRSALEAYDKAYYCFTIKDIERIMNMHIDRNRRNGRPQAQHLAGARAIQQINDQFKHTNWREGNGRPKGTKKAETPKAKAVYDYRTAHPDENVSQVARALQISRPTVYRWWNYIPEPEPGQE